jgi:hypothetical protein
MKRERRNIEVSLKLTWMFRGLLYRGSIIYVCVIIFPMPSLDDMAMQCCGLCQTNSLSRNQLFQQLQIAHGYRIVSTPQFLQMVPWNRLCVHRGHLRGLCRITSSPPIIL